MNTYKALNKQVYTLDEYSLVPIRMEDRYNIMQWRNEQIYHLRQAEPLTKDRQDWYFENVVAKLFDQEKPNQLLFSFLKNGECIGYGGLVHINWIDRNAEVSFVMNTRLENGGFESNWSKYLQLLELIAFDELKFHKLFVYAFDLRPQLYGMLESNDYFLDARLKEHCQIVLKSLKIQVLIDNVNSWIIPYAKELVEGLDSKGHVAKLIHQHREVESGDILCLLSCERIFKRLDLNRFNLVVHESDLPKGKGWSPVSWQILEGRKKIPITLFEAARSVDSGVIYLKEYIYLDGTELLSKIKQMQGIATQNIILKFLEQMPVGLEQEGDSTFYPRRTDKDSELDISKSLDDQFNLLRICDNERYPAFFRKNGIQYILKIYKDDQEY
jgi:methionyl-tRNA formyltransferase